MTIESEVWGSNIQEGPYKIPSDVAKIEKHSKHLFNRLNARSRKTIEKMEEKIDSFFPQDIPVGFPQEIKKQNMIRKKESYVAFQNAKNTPPSQNLIVNTKTNQQTFNHVNTYVIHDNAVWYRKNGALDQPWKAFYFDGVPANRPLKIQADGANLIIIDDAGYIHYKKILKEKLRIFEEEANRLEPPAKKTVILEQNETHVFTIKDQTIWVKTKNSTTSHWQPFYFSGWPHRVPNVIKLEGTQLKVIDDYDEEYTEDVSPKNIIEKLKGQNFPYCYHYAYSAITKDDKDNWKDQWFSLPYLSDVLCIMKQKKLKLPANTIDFALSNRGGFSAYWKDFGGSEHPSCAGCERPGEKKPFSNVTSCYAVCEGENFIRFADPWLPGGFHLKSFPSIPEKKIDMPSNFHFEKLSASASMLVISGKDDYGQRVIFYQLADFDSTEDNNMLPNENLTYANQPHKHPIKPQTRIYPDHYKKISADQLWKPLLIECLKDKNIDINSMTVLQTGPGNLAKEVRFATLDPTDSGYYWKSLGNNKDWQWHST